MGIGKLFVTGENSQYLFARLLCFTSNLSEKQKLKKMINLYSDRGRIGESAECVSGDDP